MMRIFYVIFKKKKKLNINLNLYTISSITSKKQNNIFESYVSLYFV